MWICDPAFLGTPPIDVFSKQRAAVKRPRGPLSGRHMLARRTFAYSGGRAELKISADDYYKLYVNGAYVGQGPAPSYPTRQFYNTYDISALLTPGENVIAVHVYYHGLATRAYQSADMRQGLWFELALNDSIIASDCRTKALVCEAWERTEPYGYKTQFPEHIDAAKLPRGWRELAFDDSDWPSASENRADDHIMLEQPTPPVELVVLKPAKTTVVDGALRVDMGRETVGAPRFFASGDVTVRCGEELDAEGHAMWQTRCNCLYENTWRASGEARDDVEFFDYMAFRYMDISPASAVEADTLRVEERRYPFDWEACRFECGAPVADGAFEICKRAVMLGAQEGFLDCPSREKGQYLGDGTVTAHAHLLLTGDKRLYRKMLFDFAATRFICPGLMAVAPGAEMQEIADYSCQYPGQIMTYYELTGDMETVRALMPVVDGLEDYFDGYAGRDGLVEGVDEKWNLVDWPQNLRDGYDFPLTQPIGPGAHNVMNAFYYGLKRDADRMRALLGLAERGGAERVKRAYIAAFLGPDGLFRDAPQSDHCALHSNVLPLYYGITPKECEGAAVSLLREKGLCCGVYMSYFALKALCRVGEHALVWELLTSSDEHSWGNMLKEGATTCMEAWGVEQKWNTSLCHPWASAPIMLLLEDIAGLYPAAPGWREVGHAPRLPREVGRLKLRLPTVAGAISAEYENGKWTITRQ